MSSDDFDDNSGAGSGSSENSEVDANPVDALLDALLSDSEESVSAGDHSPVEQPAESVGENANSTDLEEGIVSSLLDDLMSAVPGSTDPDFTEAATAIPFASDTADTDAVDGTLEGSDQSGLALGAEDPTFAIAALSANQDPVAAVEALTDPDPTTALEVPSIEGEPLATLVGSEDPTAVIDAPMADHAVANDDSVATPDDSDSADQDDGDDKADVGDDSTVVMPTPLESDSSVDVKSKDKDGVPDVDADPTIIDTSADEEDLAASPDSATPPTSGRKVESSGGGRRLADALLFALVGVFVLLGAAWAIDTLSSQDSVLRGTTYAGQSIQGLSESDLQSLLDERTVELSDQSLDVDIGDVTVTSDPVTLGVSLDDEAIINDALGAGRQGFIGFRPFSWIGRFFSEQDIEERYSYDADLTTEAAESILIAPLDQVEEPELTYEGSAIGVAPGSVGTVVDPIELVDALPSVMESGAPYQVSLAPLDESPALTDDQVKAVADEINATTAEPLALQVLDDVAVVEPDQLRAWSKLVNDGDGRASWLLDADVAQNELQPLFPSLGSEDQQARFAIVDNEPTIIPASETVICCAEDSADRIRDGLKDAPLELSEEELEELDDDDPTVGLRIVSLDPITVGADEGVAELESLGIIEEISTFTSKHACCQNRVTNIQRFADLMQGVIIRPGKSLSLNGHVGQRTREKGFVADGAINLGVLEPQVGGGISQYATTFFNASFFAGLEFIEYQSHSLYISRYPRGREATISWRRPDLEVKNTTPYGILVWNTYTPTSITVTFYSTKHLEVEALPLRRASERQCRVDITPRLITFPDGTEVEDSVYAIYRPGEGLDCNGNSTRPDLKPEPASTPTTAPATGEGETAGVTTTVPDGDDGIDDAITTTIPEDPNGDT